MMKALIFSNISFYLNNKVIKTIPKIGNLESEYSRGDICMLYIDTTCRACKSPKETSVALSEVRIHEVYCVKFKQIKKIFDSDTAEDFSIDLHHQKQSICDDDEVTIITLFEY